ncbi:MAG: hypothetical protein WC484_06870 [Candidatus Omnitrophota bacterium]
MNNAVRNTDSSLNTLLLTGAGSVKNSWGPIKNRLGSLYGQFLPESDLNLIFADIVHQQRWLFSAIKDTKTDVVSREDLKRKFDEISARYREIKSAIANGLKKAQEQGQIELNCEFGKIKQFFTGEVNIATTNWDELLQRFDCSGKGQRFSIHGNIQDQNNIFLPSEMTRECYRDNPERFEGRVKIMLDDFFKNIHTLILYGISLSPLDVELGQLLSAGFFGEKIPRRVVIVDNDPCPVYERLRFFFRDQVSMDDWKTKVELKLLCPSML